MVSCSSRKSWNRKKESACFYDETATSYRELYTEEQMRKYDAALKVLRDPFLGIVLDVGCGQGLFLQRIFANSTLRVGIDVSLGMLAGAKKVTGFVADFLCADADHLPFREQVFDSVFSFTLLQNMPDPSFTLCEILRVAGTNGLVVASFPMNSRLLEETHIWFKKTNKLWVKADSDAASKDHIFLHRKTPAPAIKK
jgi:ubiquinone/menaquinone biosynthesis C-methylase UbiE